MEPYEYFIKPQSKAQKQYCALTAFFKDGLSAEEVAKQFGYTRSAFYSLVRDFKRKLRNNPNEPIFFASKSVGRKGNGNLLAMQRLVVSLRQKGLSSTDIAGVLSQVEKGISQSGIWKILKQYGFKKLHRRTTEERLKMKTLQMSLKNKTEENILSGNVFNH